MNESSTVFIVDDDPNVRQTLVRLAHSLGYNAEEFSTGEAFLQRAATAPQNTCAVIDFSMPTMDGLEVQSKMAENQITIPIVFISGFADATNSTQAFRSGAITVLQKPVDVEMFQSAVEEALSLGSNVEQIAEARKHRHLLESLTPHERKIIMLAAEGHPNKRIASILGCSIKTIEKHRRRAYESLGVSSTAEMTRAVTMGTLYDLFQATINKPQVMSSAVDEPDSAE